jgi:hypothetical protein
MRVAQAMPVYAAMFTAGVLLGGLAGWKLVERYGRPFVVRYELWRRNRKRR